MNSKQIEEIRIHSVAQRRTRFAKSSADKSLVRVIGVAIFVHLLEALDCRSARDARTTYRAAIRIVHLPVGGFDFSYVKEKTSLPSCVFREFVFLLHSRPPDKVQAICREQERGARLMIRNFLTNLLHFIGAGIGSYLVIQRVCVLRQAHVIGARN